MEFYIVASVLILLAIVVSTGKIDSLFCRKYGPGFKDGKFTWWKLIRYNPKRMRPLLVVLLVIIGCMLLAIPVFGFPEHVMGIVIIVFAVVFSVIALLWAVEKD